MKTASYEGVGVGGIKRAVLGGSPLGIVVIYTGKGLGLLAGLGYNLNFESKIASKVIKLKINCSETINNNINNTKNMNNGL